MTLLEAVSAYLAAESLMREPCAYETAAALVLLRGRLRELADYYLEEERKLIAAYAAREADGAVKFSGTGFLFEDPARAQDYEEKRRALGGTEVDVSFEKIHAAPPERLTPAALEALAPIIEFEAA